jgi:hypothetical protein
LESALGGAADTSGGASAGKTDRPDAGFKPHRSTGFTKLPGKRIMKEYPLTSRELWTLGGLQAGSAATLSFAGWLAGFWVNSQQAIDFADRHATPPEVLAQWQAYADMAYGAAVGAGALGIFLILLSGWNVLGIIWDTTHARKS